MLIGDAERVTIIIADADLNQVGPPVTDWINIDCTKVMNEVSTGTLTVPSRPDLVDAVTTPGNRVHVLLDGAVWMSGPIEVPGAYSWSVEGDDSGPGRVTVQFASEIEYLTRAVVYPDPANASTAQGTVKQYTSTDVVETVLRNLVNLNVGPGALAARQVNKLVLGSVIGLPATSITVNYRFDPLTDVLRDICSANGSIVFDVLLQPDGSGGQQLEFTLYDPVDRSDSIFFSKDRQNLTSLATAPQAPTANAAIVAADMENEVQTITERTDTASIASWGRREVLVARTDLDASATPAPTPTQIQDQWNQDGDLALLEGHESVNITAEVNDTEFQQFGVHYQLGDTVSVELIDAQVISDVVSQVQLSGDPDAGIRVVPTIGTGSAKVGDPLLTLVRQLTRRISKLERG